MPGHAWPLTVPLAVPLAVPLPVPLTVPRTYLAHPCPSFLPFFLALHSLFTFFSLSLLRNVLLPCSLSPQFA